MPDLDFARQIFLCFSFSELSAREAEDVLFKEVGFLYLSSWCHSDLNSSEATAARFDLCIHVGIAVVDEGC